MTWRGVVRRGGGVACWFNGDTAAIYAESLSSYATSRITVRCGLGDCPCIMYAETHSRTHVSKDMPKVYK